MPWIILTLTSVLSSTLTFVVGILAGGFFLLVILNGFSERQAVPLIFGYLAIILLVSFALTGLMNVFLARIFFAARKLSIWAVLGLTLLVLIVIFIFGFMLLVLPNMVSWAKESLFFALNLIRWVILR